jgi:hypothetical protein
MCSKTERKVYIQVIKLGKQPIEQFVTIENNDFSNLLFIWLLIRGVTLTRINFVTLFYNDNLIVRKWLAGISDINTTKTIFNLKFKDIECHHSWSKTDNPMGFDQFPELQQNVCNLINQCSSLKSLEFLNCGICDVTLMNSLNLSGLNINELMIVNQPTVENGKVQLIESLMKFNSLSILVLQFTCPLTHLDQVEVVALMKLNPNLTHLDLQTIRLVDDTFLSSLRTECKALEWLRCISKCGPTGRYPTESSISEYLKAPHQNMKHFEFVTDDTGDFTFDFDQLGDITAKVRRCSRRTIKSVFTGLTKLSFLDDARSFRSRETLAEYLLNIGDY